MSDYNIRKTTGTCAACAQTIEHGQELFSMILLEEAEPARRDYCVACFQALERRPDEEFAWWRTRMTERGRARRVVDFNTLRELFFKMAEHANDEYRKLCYLLGLLLMRKRALKLEEFTTENGRDYVIVTCKQREQPLKLEAPTLLPHEFAELRDRLKLLLDIDVEDEMGAPPAASVESASETG